MKLQCCIIYKVKVSNGVVKALIVLTKQESRVLINQIYLLGHLFTTLNQVSSNTITEICNSLFVNLNDGRLLVAWSYPHDISSIAEKRYGLDEPKMVAHENHLFLQPISQGIFENISECVSHDSNQHIKEHDEDHASCSDPHYKHRSSVIWRHIKI